MYAKTNSFFPIIMSDLQYPSFSLSRSKVPSPSTRRTRWRFAIWGLCLFAGLCFLCNPPPKKKPKRNTVFTLHHTQASIFFLFFFWGWAKKKQWKFGNHPSCVHPRNDQRRPWRPPYFHPPQRGSVSPATLRELPWRWRKPMPPWMWRMPW